MNEGVVPKRIEERKNHTPFRHPKDEPSENICEKRETLFQVTAKRRSICDTGRRLGSQVVFRGLNVPLSSYSILRDNPLTCSCDLHWLQQWHLNSREDVDSQTCFSGNIEVSLGSLQLDNCSECVLGLRWMSNIIHKMGLKWIQLDFC